MDFRRLPTLFRWVFCKIMLNGKGLAARIDLDRIDRSDLAASDRAKRAKDPIQPCDPLKVQSPRGRPSVEPTGGVGAFGSGQPLVETRAAGPGNPERSPAHWAAADTWARRSSSARRLSSRQARKTFRRYGAL